MLEKERYKISCILDCILCVMTDECKFICCENRPEFNEVKNIKPCPFFRPNYKINEKDRL